MRSPWPAVLLLLLAGCSDDAPVKTSKSRAARIADAEAAVSKTPVPRTYQVNGNELVVLEVPTHDGRGFVDYQRCFVWRDAEYKAATLSCAQPLDVVAGEP